jgi:hypothetical protein
MVLAAALAAFAQPPQGRLLKYLDFESAEGFSAWPADAHVELDPENPKAGRTSLVFTPDNHFVAYFYQPMTGGHKYLLTCWVRMEGRPIDRCALAMSFSKQGGGNGSAGRKEVPLNRLAAADNQWHECRAEFEAPAEAVQAQVMLAMFRANTTIFIDEVRLYDLSLGAAPSVPAGTVRTAGAPLQTLVFQAGARGLMKWPSESAFDFVAADGRKAIRFTPARSYSVYFYQALAPGEYVFEFDWKALEKPIPRCALIVFFTSPGGKRGDLGNRTVPLATLGEATGGWNHAAVNVKVPAGVGRTCQVMLALYRTNTTVEVADLKIFRRPAP